ncbi:ATP-binding protein [Bacillus haynesii]|uniref:ATP-binding protein n=2 Tax=Bacillus haynesii TaxID=1925021 RepID=UPI0012BA3061|nr:ATP-binding protein [Bacillus haynesii]TWK28601.1 ATP-dependent zinc metalloprotease FtsH [Bacillus licheniformis]MBU8683722.1 ATP-binding protein [Bacillus haynesii]MCY7837511.1 ATP-binding protein [Bacillus haynesii]MCY7843845.1 ATP-binding protein [Bacillus haynesii]MCY7967188.1 ATP-binding protein [Bacillus haynesii]
MKRDDTDKRAKVKVIQFDQHQHALTELEQHCETFADVGGLEDIKKKINMDFILPLQNPEYFKAFGKATGGSLLLFGPPGCGKTFIAKAIAGEIQANFIHLELQAILSMYVGQSEHNLHDIFEKARDNSPCVLFIDELDSIGGNRQGMSQHHDRVLVNQLLIELDGLGSFNDGVYVIGATNTPWYLDPALRRPGRFNKMVFMPPPSEEERVDILNLKLSGKPHNQIDALKIAKKTCHFSGADLEQLVSDALDQAIERSLRQGKLSPVQQTDLETSLQGRVPSTLEWFSTAKNYAMFSDANKEYQSVLDYMKRTKLK